MNGVSRASGAGYTAVRVPNGWPGPLTGGFTEYRWHPSRVEDYAVIERHLLKDRISPIDAVMPDLERLSKINSKAAKRLAKTLTDRAYADLRASKSMNVISIDQLQEYLNSVPGAQHAMFIALQREHHDITREESDRVFLWLGEEEQRRQREAMEGIDALGNSTGPTPGADGVAGATAGSPAGSTGGSSTATSPASTAGPATSSTA